MAVLERFQAQCKPRKNVKDLPLIVISVTSTLGWKSMDATWQIDVGNLAVWREFVESNKDKALPMRRRSRNVRRNDINLSKDEIWRVLVGCQVTTQQRSGPNSAVSRFLKSESPALHIGKCRLSKSVRNLIERECKNAGLRRAPTIANNLERIFSGLESLGWDNLLKQLNTLVQNTSSKKERSVVSYLLSEKKFPGLGQKQARNFIQWLGLSRYEIPLDSRILKKMKEFGATFVPSGSALTDESVYLFVQSGLQQIAKSLDIYPCELDACIFASFDIDEDVEVGEIS